MSTIEWPPIYQLKRNKQARAVRLRTTREEGLIITIPPRFALRELPGILEHHKSWILKQLERFNKIDDRIPAEINLRAIQETWKLIFLPTKNKLQIMERPFHELVVMGKMDEAVCKTKLAEWVKRKSCLFLCNAIENLSNQMQLIFSQVNVRNQKTLWGSCNIDKIINLNYKLIFFPRAVADYVMIHELAHLKHLNHSEKFWQLVSCYDPDYLEHKKQLRQSDLFIPGWL